MLLPVGALLVASGCAAPKPVPPQAPVPRQNLFVLLPDADGTTGAITVTNAGGTQELTQAGQAVRVERGDQAPSAPFPLDEPELRRRFGDALAAQPTAAVHFLLYFPEGQDELTPESRARLADIVRAIRERRSTDVSVVGHTDTRGDSQSNYRLGLRRAERVVMFLRSVGVDPAVLEVRSHGETDPLVKTPDGVAEPRNRRVEVVVR